MQNKLHTTVCHPELAEGSHKIPCYAELVSASQKKFNINTRNYATTTT